MAKSTAVSVETMEVGEKGGGKHWTAEEIAARQAAAEKLKRKKKADLVPPDWLSEGARAVWDRKLSEVKGLNAANDLLDALDSEILAVYCEAFIQFQLVSQVSPKTSDMIKELQAWARILKEYAEKLGFTPNARARLVKKIADKNLDKFGGKFD